MANAKLLRLPKLDTLGSRGGHGLRRLALPVLDALLTAGGLFLAYLIRFDGRIPLPYWRTLPSMIAVWVVVRLALLVMYRGYSYAWRYASVFEMVAILSAVTLGSVLLVLYNMLLPLIGYAARAPRSVMAIEWFLGIFTLGGVRFLIRAYHDSRTNPGLRRPNTGDSPRAGKRLLIVGAGEAGAMALREIRRSTDWQVMGFVDDDDTKARSLVMGVPVLGGRDNIPSIVKVRGVNEILVAMPSASRQTMLEVVAIARRTGCPVRMLPALYELIDGRVAVNQIRDVQLEDLLGREPARIDVHGVSAYLRGQTVLVTGAGGSIGSEICRQVAAFAPRHLVLLGHGENSIFEIGLELTAKWPNVDIETVIADVQDAAKIDRVFEHYRPGVVFHAAAHKHVPLMEEHPDEAVKNNVLGTRNLAVAAKAHGVKKFVLISTDKAVNPRSVMGMTKRLAEMLIQSLNGGTGTTFMAVRFGNVLGSRGSVVPIFKRQIAAGGPVTVTHPEMKRYFMTIPEASQLVIQAGAMGQGGEVFVLDMGEPVKIVDLAKNLITLSGFQPGVDIKIEFTGVRPGEKLSEDLLTAEEGTNATFHKRIFVAKSEIGDHRKLLQGIATLELLTKGGDLQAVRNKLVELMPPSAQKRLLAAQDEVAASQG